MFRFPPLTPFVRVLLIALVVSLVLGAILQNFAGLPVVGLLALNPSQLSGLTALQVFTHSLVVIPTPGAILPLAISVFFLWWSLAPLEEQFGRMRAIQLTLVATVGSALPAIAATFALPAYAGIVAGPSVITLAAIAAYVGLLPARAEMNFGRFSVPVRTMLWINMGIIIINFLTGPNVSELFASLAAIGVGLLFTRHVLLATPRRAPASRRGSSPRLRLVKKDDDDDDEPKRWLN